MIKRGLFMNEVRKVYINVDKTGIMYKVYQHFVHNPDLIKTAKTDAR